MNLEYSWEGLKKGYYLLRGKIKSDRALCEGKIILGERSYTLPIARSGTINHIVKINGKADSMKIIIPITSNGEVEKDIFIKKLNFFEALYHFYRRILGVFFSKNPITKQLKETLRLSLIKALLSPEKAYYSISYLRYRRVCGFKDYNQWLEEYRKREDYYWRKREKPNTPKFLVVILKRDGKLLERTVNSLKAQICAPDRIFLSNNKGLSSLLEKATEDYVLLLMEGEMLSPYALCCFKAFAKEKNYPDVIYADNDYVKEDGSFNKPCFKPDWSPDYFFEYDYIKFPVAFKREILKIEEFFSNYETILDLLKEHSDLRIAHIPALLGSRHKDEGRFHKKFEKLKEFFLERAEVQIAKEPYTFRVIYKQNKEPKVSIIVPTKDKQELIKNCINSLLEKTDYENYEIIIIDNGSREEEVWKFYESLKDNNKIAIYSLDIPFNFSKLVNYGVSKAEGEIICLLNNDTQVITECWLREMVAHALRKEVGVVGAKLLYPDNTVQHGGVIMGIWNGTDHAFKGMPDGDGYMFRLSTTQNYISVTAACMVFRKEVFYEVEGFDEAFEVDFNDVDFCLRVFEKGYRILWTPYAVLYHFESKSKKQDDKRAKREIELLRRRWKKYIQKDPYYNRNLTLYDTNFGLNFFPKFYCLE
ncbi:glycosyltransferase family 2 protein [Thermocrinis sp.]